MKLVLKYSLIIYVSISYVIIYNVANFFILKSNPEIYSFVPQDANQVIEVNTKSFIIKTANQFFHNEDYFLSYFGDESDDNIDAIDFNKTKRFGVDISSRVIFFSESWECETVWYCILGIDDEVKFSAFAEKQKEIVAYEVVTDFAICLLTKPSQKENVFKHLKQIANQKVKSFDSKIDLSSTFNSNNEINYYVSPEDNEYIIDGLLSVNFNGENITFNGEYNTIGSLNVLSTISQYVKPESALSLRTTFNYLDDVPGFNELVVDYESTNFVTSNELIPIHVAPNLNMFVSSEKSDYGKSFFDKIDSYDNFTVDSSSNQLRYLNQLSFSIGYKLNTNSFIVSNDSFAFSREFNREMISNALLELNIKPDLYFSNIKFLDDELNPPKLIAGLKINMFKNILSEFSSINKLEQIYCSVVYSDDKSKLISTGEIKFKEKSGHSIVEAMFMSINVLKAIETFSKFQ